MLIDPADRNCTLIRELQKAVFELFVCGKVLDDQGFAELAVAMSRNSQRISSTLRILNRRRQIADLWRVGSEVRRIQFVTQTSSTCL